MANSEKNDSKNLIPEKYSAEDLCKVFEVKGRFDPGQLLKNIENDKVVKYFMNKKKSDTGTFLREIINTRGEYKNLENICKHAIIRIDDCNGPPKLINAIRNLIAKQEKFFNNINRNKLPNGKMISLISSLRNKKLKTVLKNFFAAVAMEMLWRLYDGYLIEFLVKSTIYEIEKKFEEFLNKHLEVYKHPAEGLDIYRSGNGFSEEKIETELKKVINPIQYLAVSLGGFALVSVLCWDGMENILSHALDMFDDGADVYAAGAAMLKSLVDSKPKCIVTDLFREVGAVWECTYEKYVENLKDEALEIRLHLVNCEYYGGSYYKSPSVLLSSFEMTTECVRHLISHKCIDLVTPRYEYLSTEVRDKIRSIIADSKLQEKFVTVFETIIDRRFNRFRDALESYCARAKILSDRKRRKEDKKQKKQNKIPGPIKFKFPKPKEKNDKQSKK